MKPILIKVGAFADNQITIIERCDPYFNTPFHFHPECELVFVTESNGKRIVGDSIESFEVGDMVFLGPHIPHVWYNDETYYQNNEQLKARSVVIYFPKDIFGDKFYGLPETKALTDLFHRAQRGMKIEGPTYDLLKEEILTLPKKEGLERIISLLGILKVLTETKDVHYLASTGYSHAFNAKDNHKIDEVFKYVMSNFSKEISLHDVASITNLSPQSFCRFFKNRTKKSFVQFLNEVRIGHACKRLTEEDWSIAEIAYSCGFKNLSNFNRFFKEIVGKTPKEYKNELRLKEA